FVLLACSLFNPQFHLVYMKLSVLVSVTTSVFKQKEVELQNTINGLHQIKGLRAGQRVATEGAFFLASEMAKGGFVPHNH
ncbi:MAG: hypothetical protein KZQ70_14725, partial [gamma proteobacterium symbiont of Lucinoma myriamae]|nr:hypothetical protein [gamma proteobacterium symbiont of Lucinoma myriamae]MCU7819805.1 hypothetical protein [gamma proteobacterium symbiont of Lucinoma myriamae]MCU7833443.1 hypothetical protein [gamma proteobacterium symbiont of Lucinoma myriamae]